MNTSPTYCKLSHVSLAVQNKGDVCVCNKNTKSFTHANEDLMFLYDTGLQQAWNSDTRKSIVNNLDQGVRDQSCQVCWDDEDSGNGSMRQAYNAKLSLIEPMAEQPRALIIKPSNVCNLGCRMCQPVTSSGLYQDFYKLETVLNTFSGTFNEYTSQFETIRDGFHSDNLPLWDTFEKWIPGLTFLDIYGGEPMLAPAMWKRIISAADAGKTANTDAQMHTNGTIWNQDYVDSMTKFKSFNIGISIDASDPKHLSYIRHGADPEKLKQNISRYVELTKKHSNVSAYICVTASIFNIWYIDQIVDELGQYGLGIGMNPVNAPTRYDFRRLPMEVKNTLIQRLGNYHGQHQAQIGTLVNLLKHNIPGCNIEFPKFWHELVALDKIRDQKFKEVMPEYYQALITAQDWLKNVE